MTHYTGDKLPPYYIGSTSIKKVENGYHGTVSSEKYSSIWKSEQKDNPHLFKTSILNRHATREEAYLDEIKWQTKLNVVKSDLFVNLKVHAPTFNRAGVILSDDTKTKLSNANMGKSHSPERRQAQSRGQIGKKRGPHSEEHKMKIGKSRKGKLHSEEAKIKMSISSKGQKAWNKGIPQTEETKQKISKTLKSKSDNKLE
jgi:hypothetical protein